MTKTKHTPGPWTYKLKNAGNGFIIRSADEIAGNICDVYMTNDRSVAEDRARLISAAPDLLEALQQLVDLWEQGLLCWEDDMPAAKAAIAKAEGDS